MERKIIGLSQGKRSVQASELLEVLKSRIKGQDPVIYNFLKYFEGFISGLRRPNNPVYKGLFLGLPNVGKRLFVESLAEYFFGNNKYYSEISCGAFNPETVSMVPAMLARAEIDLPSLLRDRHYCTIAGGQKKLQENLGKVQAELFVFCKQANDDYINSEELKNNIAKTTKQCINIFKAINVLQKRLDKFRPENPISIVVFSDLEKSCPTMLNIIQRILRDGRICFENGEEVDLTNSIVIVTSTIISEVVMEEIEKLSKKGSLGFTPSNKEEIEKMDRAIYDRFTDTKKIYRSSIKFAVENISLDLLSLFDRISIFRPLFKDSLKEIMDVELEKFCEELGSVSFPISLEVSEEVKDFIVNESLDRPEFGAATLLAKFDKHIRREVARLKNLEEIKENDLVLVKLEKNKVVFSRAIRKDEDISAD